MLFRRFGTVVTVLGCAAALSMLAAPPAAASLVEVVRLDGSGGLAMTPGDLATPDVPSSASGSGTVLAPGNPSSPDLGPIFAEVTFYSINTESLSSIAGTSEPVPMNAGLTGSTASESGLLGGAALVGPSDGSVSGGTLVGTVVPGSTLSGTIDGSIPMISTTTIEGTLTDAVAAPIPGVAWLFGTGLAGLAGFLRRTSVRRRLLCGKE